MNRTSFFSPLSFRWHPIWFAIGLIGMGYGLLGQPRGADATFTFYQATGAFFLFLFFAFSARVWGAWLRRFFLRVEPNSGTLLWLDLALGTSGLALVAALLGFLGMVGPGLRVPAVLFLLLGSVLEGRFTRPSLSTIEGFSFLSDRPSRAERLGLAIVILLLLIRILHGFQLSRHGDPFIYELMAPRLWFDSGHIFVPRFMPYIAQAGSWSFLDLWGAFLLGGQPGEGLVALQHFGQWSHIGFGYFGTALVLAAVMKNLKLNRNWIWFWILAALSTPELKIVASLAKCDWGAIFWFGSGLTLILLSESAKSSVHFWAGVLIGIGFTAKLSVGYTLVPAFLLIALGRGLRSALIVSLGCVLAALPILARNAYWTANPFFPALHQYFPAPLFGPSLLRAHGALYRADTLGEWLRGRTVTLLQVLGFAPLLWMAWIVPVYQAGVSRKRWAIWALPWLGISLYLLHLGPHGIVRWMGPSLVALVVAGAIALEKGVTLLPAKISPKVFGFFALSTVVLADLPLYTLAQVFGPKFQTGPAAMAIFFNGVGKKWVREHLPSGKKILLVADNEPYYLSQFEVHVYDESVDTDRLFTNARTPLELGHGLEQQGFDYILDFSRSDTEVSGRLLELLKLGLLTTVVKESWGTVFALHANSNPVSVGEKGP